LEPVHRFYILILLLPGSARFPFIGELRPLLAWGRVRQRNIPRTHWAKKISPLSRPALFRRDRDKWFNDFFQVLAMALRTTHFLRVVFFDGQYLTKFLVALAANVFVEWHIVPHWFDCYCSRLRFARAKYSFSL
jgi:hypothetical protein